VYLLRRKAVAKRHRVLWGVATDFEKQNITKNLSEALYRSECNGCPRVAPLRHQCQKDMP
jgi:hypothetical protein